MKKLLYTLFFISISSNLLCQNDARNILTLETGIFNKGQIGLSYSRLIQAHKSIQLSVEVAGGIGLGRHSEKNRYASGGVHLLLGKSVMKVSLGLDIKYYHLILQDYQIQLFITAKESPKFEGVTPAPAFGFVYQPGSGFYFKMRSTMNWFHSSSETRVRPGFGVSVGFTF